MSNLAAALERHQGALKSCDLCPDMIGPVVTGQPVISSVFLIGQAPGIKEGEFGKPFAWTAGKTMFHWFTEIGLNEETFRQRVYMAAVCRCFPGKNPKGGDRVPSKVEVEQCATWMDRELKLLRPALIIPVGKLAISQLMPVAKLNDVVGQTYRLTVQQFDSDVIPLPHPSGASTWHRSEPGKTLLWRSLQLIEAHPAWKTICRGRVKIDGDPTFKLR
ncbi:MAG: uracil-DNA glycosylase family protein [Methylococcales bacterium]